MIRQTVAEVVTETEFYIYGSFATGLSLPWSDIDIVIKIPQLYYNGYAAILDSIEQNLKVYFILAIYIKLAYRKRSGLMISRSSRTHQSQSSKLPVQSPPIQARKSISVFRILDTMVLLVSSWSENISHSILLSAL